MRSPPGARVPPRTALQICVVVGLLTACTQGTEPVSEQPTPSVSPAPTEEKVVGGGGSGADAIPETEVQIKDKDSKRAVRGEAPPYVEIDSASVDGSVDRLLFEVALAGPVPEKMPDDQSVLRVTFTVTAAGGRRFTFDAQCVHPGWGTYASGGPEDFPIPELALRGRRLQLAVDPAYMGGLQPFDWLVNVAWTSGAANYAFDAAPKQGFASYP